MLHLHRGLLHHRRHHTRPEEVRVYHRQRVRPVGIRCAPIPSTAEIAAQNCVERLSPYPNKQTLPIEQESTRDFWLAMACNCVSMPGDGLFLLESSTLCKAAHRITGTP